MNKALGKAHRNGISLMQLADMFPDEGAARKWFETRIWPAGRHCLRCKSRKTREASHAKMPYWCTDCHPRSSVKFGAVMQASKPPLRKWVYAMYLHMTSLRGVSNMKPHRDIGVSQDTAWHLLQRIHSLKHFKAMNISKKICILFLFILPNLTVYGQIEEIYQKGRTEWMKALEFAVEEAQLKIEANNLWIAASNNKKEIKDLKKNNETQTKQINTVQRRIKGWKARKKSDHIALRKNKARGFKFFGNIAGMNSIDSEKFITIYQKKEKIAKKRALEDNEEAWLEVAEKWQEVLNKVNEVMHASGNAAQYFFLGAEMMKPGIVIGNDQEAKREMENFKLQVLRELDENGSF